MPMPAIAAVLKARRDLKRQNAGVDPMPAVDNKDGVEPDEKIRVGHVAVSAKVLLERLRLEEDLTMMIMKLPAFLLCIGCFVAALVEFSPPAAIQNVHRHLINHFGLGRVSYHRSFSEVIQYMEQFEKLNEELQATSSMYWCESRYAEYVWDAEHSVPMWSCVSPRQHALTLSNDSSWAWSNVESPALDAGDLDPSVCFDDDAQLQQRTGDLSTNCSTFSKVCESELGLEYCRRFCGYCAPFSYKPRSRFAKKQVTMLPVVVYQSRYQKGSCDGFAEVYEHQPHNEVLWKMPALDGERAGELVHCTDQKKRLLEEDYALELDCPESIANTSSCLDGKVKITRRHSFRGEPVYPVMLLEPHHDVVAMKNVEWLDAQTASVSLSTMVYTKRLEIFTSLTVDYVVDEAGNLDGTYTMISYRDLTGGGKTTFIACLCICAGCACISLFFSVRHMIHNPEDCKWGLELYELISRSVLMIFPIVLLVSWQMQVPMADEFDQLLHVFLGLPSFSEEDTQGAMGRYFEVKDHIYKEVSWLSRNSIVAYLVLYVQFLQFVFYFSAHPKMGVLTSTVSKAMSPLLHFLGLFWVLFLMLAFMAHWMLGKYIKSFGTFPDAVKSQGRMIFGEFIHASGAEDLHGSMVAMYWLYACTFMLVVFFTLLNFFLAIIVEAFADVSEVHKKDKFSSSFLGDLIKTPWSTYRSYKRGWPARTAIMHYCHDRIEIEECIAEGKPPPNTSGPAKKTRKSLEKLLFEIQAKEDFEEGGHLTKIKPAELAGAFEEFAHKPRLTGFLYHYFKLCPRVLTKADAEEDLDYDMEMAEVNPNSGYLPSRQMMRQRWHRYWDRKEPLER